MLRNTSANSKNEESRRHLGQVFSKLKVRWKAEPLLGTAAGVASETAGTKRKWGERETDYRSRVIRLRMTILKCQRIQKKVGFFVCLFSVNCSLATSLQEMNTVTKCVLKVLNILRISTGSFCEPFEMTACLIIFYDWVLHIHDEILNLSEVISAYVRRLYPLSP